MEPTAFTHPFRVAGVHRLIKAARRAARFSENGPEGWRKSPVDPRAVLDVFGALRLKPGFTLRAYLPQGRCPRDNTHILDPPLPSHRPM